MPNITTLSNVNNLLNPLLTHTPNMGKVYLVGAGTGDPELLTIKAWRIICQADVICYDNLVSEAILQLNMTAEKIFVGKRRSNHSMSQAEINLLLVSQAQQGKRVVRLKSGDPFIFGRGGEEMQTLVAYGVPCESVAGITSASAAANGVNIPLTHRDHAQSVKFVTAYLKTDTPNTDFASFIEPQQTVVFYMGLHSLAHLTAGLMAAGKPYDTPFAIIANISRHDQQVLVGTLANITELQAAACLPAPALMIMGDVVKLYHELNPQLPCCLTTVKHQQTNHTFTDNLMPSSFVIENNQAMQDIMANIQAMGAA